MLFRYVLAAVIVAQGCVAMKGRITDGENATPHQFPYQVSIIWGVPPILKYRHVCGGSVISDKWILTAGHCITGIPKIGHQAVLVGKHIVNKKEDGQQYSDIVQKIVHPGYPGGVAQHDIGLLELKTPLVFNDKVSAVKLPERDRVHSGEAVLSGWGSISKKWFPVMPTILQTAKVPIVDTETCAQFFHQLPGNGEIFDTQLCTGPLGGSISACSGDSGGPLVQYNEEGIPEQVGIVSWGSYPCGSAGSPSVYTRVSSYIDWINEKLSLS